MTRADKFEEVFGYRPATDQVLCNEHDWCGENDACKYCLADPNRIGREEDWWNAEYKEKSPWTKCSDGLPDMYVDVLGTVKENGDVVKVMRWKTCFDDADWEWKLVGDAEDYFYHQDEIIAWMPLPKGYKESEEVND